MRNQAIRIGLEKESLSGCIESYPPLPKGESQFAEKEVMGLSGRKCYLYTRNFFLTLVFSTFTFTIKPLSKVPKLLLTIFEKEKVHLSFNT